MPIKNGIFILVCFNNMQNIYITIICTIQCYKIDNNCKLLQCKKLYKQLDYKSIKIKWYKYMKIDSKRLTSMIYK